MVCNSHLESKASPGKKIIKDMTNIGIIVQARNGSRRLPGKMLIDLGGQDLLGRVVSNLRKVSQATALIVATTVSDVDDVLERRCASLAVDCFRGSESDVLSRYYHAATERALDVIIRIPGDNPFIIPALIDRFIMEWNLRSVDYLSNILENTYPIGMHVEIFSYSALELAYREATDPMEREHVTPYIYNSGKFRLLNLRSAIDFSSYRLTIDYQEDVIFARALFDLLAGTELTDVADVVDLIKSVPHLKPINSMYWKNQAIKPDSAC
jgi:spore coat polysaccharide biosynthesis protein SpsF (cytidylyltransferase family)